MNGMVQQTRRARAFTLVELLVVIGIIAVLISILLPALSKARDAANRVACMSNMRQAAMALRLYANDNKDVVPAGYVQSWKDRSNTVYGVSGATKKTALWGLLYDSNLLTNGAVLFCPTEVAPRDWAFNRAFMYNLNPAGPSSNTLNPWPPGVAFPGAQTWSAYSLRPTINWQIPDPSNPPNGQIPFTPPSPMTKLNDLRGLTLVAEFLHPDTIAIRHKTGINVIGADGSGKYVDYPVFKNNLDLYWAQATAPTARPYMLNDPTGDSKYNDTNLSAGGVWVDIDKY